MSTQDFTVFLLPRNGGGYVVFFPYHPECITDGDTVDEALRNAREAIELHIEGLQEEGMDLMLEYVDADQVVIATVQADLSLTVPEPTVTAESLART